MTSLDIACGRGEVPALMAEAGACCIGLDYSPAVLRIATQVRSARIDQFPPEGCMELTQADATRLPFADASFDRITLLDIVEHLTPRQLESMFREVSRLLAQGGYAVIHTLPNRWVYDIGYRIARFFRPSMPANPRGKIEKQIHINEQDLPRLHRMLEQCGLQHHLWLEQLMPAQARWKIQQEQYGDNRDKVYPLMVGPAGRLMELFSLTPAKLLLSNDIFGLVWCGEKPPLARKLPLALTERIASKLPVRS
jgi:ubiquinone/menaquinone biosynthesis C-methylase UbiE